jgi:hypothetical protein
VRNSTYKARRTLRKEDRKIEDGKMCGDSPLRLPPRGARLVARWLWDGREFADVVLELKHRGIDHGSAVALVLAVEDELRRAGAL